MKRIESIDITRGFVMVVMALDHVRDFIHKTSMSLDPTNLQTTTTVIFLTRWITHICAPSFVFLSGVSAYISFRKRNNLAESRRFLITRGLWLLILEITFINFALWFDIHFRLLLMEVIAAIGLSFIVLGLLLKLPSRIIGATGLILIFSHDLFRLVTLPADPAINFLSAVLFRPNMIQLTPGLTFFTAYPLIPWLGILLAGFACGELFELTAEKRKKIFLKISLGILSCFVLLRLINHYGDPVAWTSQKSALFTFFSFINLTKYPPSLMFTLLFLGITFLILFLSENVKNRISEVLIVYGRVPLFYFIIHLFIIHSLLFVVLYLQGFGSESFLFGPFKNGRPESGGGVGIVTVYLIWIGVVALLYPVCRWYGNFKAEHNEIRFLRYL